MTTSAFQHLTRAWGEQPVATDGALAEVTPPLCTVVIPPSGFAAEWAKRPSEPVRIGMRLLSEGQLSTAAALAEQEARAEFPNGGDTYLDAFGSFLMTNILSRAMTTATNIQEAFFPEAPEVACRGALTSDTVKRLWERYGKMTTEESPLSKEADDIDVTAFAVRLMSGAVNGLEAGPQRRMRRMITELAAELAAVPDETLPEVNE